MPNGGTESGALPHRQQPAEGTNSSREGRFVDFFAQSTDDMDHESEEVRRARRLREWEESGLGSTAPGYIPESPEKFSGLFPHGRDASHVHSRVSRFEGMFYWEEPGETNNLQNNIEEHEELSRTDSEHSGSTTGSEHENNQQEGPIEVTTRTEVEQTVNAPLDLKVEIPQCPLPADQLRSPPSLTVDVSQLEPFPVKSLAEMRPPTPPSAIDDEIVLDDDEAGVTAMDPDSVAFHFPSRKTAHEKAHFRRPMDHFQDKNGYDIPGTAHLYSLMTLCPTLRSSKRLSRIGVAVPLYFSLTWNLIVLVFVLSLVQIYPIVNNYRARGLPEDETTFINRGSIGAHGTVAQPWGHGLVQFTVAVLTAVFLIHHRRYLIGMAKNYDRVNITSSDFTVQVLNLQQGYRSEDLVREFFSQFGEIHKIVIGLRVSKIIRFYQHRQSATMDFEEKVMRAKFLDRYFGRVLKGRGKALTGVEKATRKSQKIDMKFARAVRTNLWETTGDCFVTFESEDSAKKCLNTLRMGLRQRAMERLLGEKLGRAAFLNIDRQRPKFHGRRLHVVRAPEPSDLHWHNLEVKFCERVMRKTVTWIVVLLVILTAGTVFTVFERWKVTLRNTSSGVWSEVAIRSLSLAGSTGIVFVNWCIKKFIIAFSNFEKDRSITEQAISIMVKLVTATLLNSTLVVLFVFNNTADWYKDGGAADSVFYLVCFNSLLPWSVNLFRIKYWAKRTVFSWCCCSQSKVNEMLDWSPFDWPERYANMIKTYSIGLCYGAMLPIVYPITFAGLCLIYWSDKLQLIRVCHKPPEHGDRLAEAARIIVGRLFVIQTGLAFLFSYEQLRNDETISNKDYTLNITFLILTLVMAAIYIAIPTRWMVWNSRVTKFMNPTVQPEIERKIFSEICRNPSRPHGLQEYNLPVPAKLYKEWTTVPESECLKSKRERRMSVARRVEVDREIQKSFYTRLGDVRKKLKESSKRLRDARKQLRKLRKQGSQDDMSKEEVAKKMWKQAGVMAASHSRLSVGSSDAAGLTPVSETCKDVRPRVVSFADEVPPEILEETEDLMKTPRNESVEGSIAPFPSRPGVDQDGIRALHASGDIEMGLTGMVDSGGVCMGSPLGDSDGNTPEEVFSGIPKDELAAEANDTDESMSGFSFSTTKQPEESTRDVEEDAVSN